MTNKELQSLVENISQNYFQLPFRHKAQWNSRLRTTGGRYHLKTHNLDFNPKLLHDFDNDILIGIIKHELCHYHLHLSGKGYQHKDKDFKMLLKKVNGLRYCPRFSDTNYRLIYQCKGCGIKVYRQRQLDTLKYICKKCHHHFEVIYKRNRD